MRGALRLHLPPESDEVSSELTHDEVEDLESLLGVVRRRRWVLMVGAVVVGVAVVLSAFALVIARDSNAQIHALSAEAAANQAQARDFQSFLQRFVAEENYVCSMAASMAVHDGLPPPPKNICAVALPTGRPPAATPSPAPSSATPSPAVTASPRPSAVVYPSASSTVAPSPWPSSTPQVRGCLMQLLCLRLACSRLPHCG